MTHNDIDTLVKSWIIDAATRPANPVSYTHLTLPTKA